MKKLVALTVSIGLVLLTCWLSMPNEKEQYISFIESHPYNNREVIVEEDLKAIPKQDRPDLAYEREFLLTMDPVLRRPTPEVLVPTLKLVSAFKRAYLQKTLPGSELNQSKWKEIGPNDYGGRTRAVMFDPNDVTKRKVFAGGVGGGIWYNNDITNNDSVWHSISDLWANMAVTAIDYDKSNPQIMYVGTGEGWLNADAIRGFGVWKSIDGGLTWNQLLSTTGESFNTIQSLVVHPTTNALLVGTGEGLYKSTDGGDTFSSILGGFIADITFAANNYMYVATGNLSTTGKLYGNASDGGSFTLLSGNGLSSSSSIGRIQISTAPTNDSVVYVLTHNRGSNDVEGIYRSSNLGGNWTKLTMPTWSGGGNFARGQAWYDLVSVVSPLNDSVVFVGGVDLFRSNDAGQTWTQISYWYLNRTSPVYVHADHHELVFVPGSDSLLVSGSDGGLSITTDLGNNWETRNNHYNVTQFYAAAIHPDAGNNSYISGAQDNGTILVREPDLTNGTSVNGADGAYCFIDQNEPQYAFVSSQNGNFRRLLNWVNNGSVIGGSTGEFINPADYDDQENILYTVIKNSNTKLNRISNATGSVQREQLDISVSGSVTHIRVSPYTDAGKSNIFLGTGGGQVIYITDADDDGLAQSVDLNIPGFGSISCVEIGRDDKELLVTRYGYGVTSVYYTKDAGVNWVEVEGNLPNMPVRWALFNPTNRNEVILATEVGVWGTSNVNAESVVWTPQINGMANVRVDMLQYRTSDNQVLATTHGRGMFTSEAFNILDPLQVDFKADQIYVNPGEPVNFTNLSNGFSDGFEWYFEGAETTNFTGETPPAIRYVNSGCFQVTLTGTRDTASVISDKTCYIHVSPTACEDIFSYNVEPDSVFMTIPTIDSANFSLDLYDQDGFNVSSSLAGNGYNSNWIIKDLRGNNVYAATSRFSPKGKADNWIIFGPITIPTQRAMLHWKHIMYFNALRDGYDVLATVSGNTVNDFKQNGIKLLSYKDNDDKTLGHSSLTYNEVSIAPSLLGQQVYFAFRHTAEEMYVLGLDEFGVSVCDEISPIAPVADFKADSLNIKMGETTNLTDLSTNFTTSWTWDFDGGIGNINEQHPTVLFNEPGCKKIMLWSTNEAGTDSTSKTCYINVKDVTSIQSYASETIMTTFPNPFSNKLNLKAKQKDLKIRVFNAAGAIIMTTEIPAMELAINTQEWSSGLYVIEITSGAHREVQKLMKE